MSEIPPSPSAPDRRPFQFSLAAAFSVVTGLCIILSLVVWDPNVGSVLAILTVGSFWTLAAVRAGYRRLAYHLASVPLGVIGYGLLSLPISPATYQVLSAWKSWPHWQPAVMMCFSMSVVALALRRPIRRPGGVRALATGLTAICLTAALFGWCCFLPPASRFFLGGVPPLQVVWLAVLTPVFATIVGMMSLHLAWPAAILFCVLLRWIDPEVREAEAPAATRKERKQYEEG